MQYRFINFLLLLFISSFGYSQNLQELEVLDVFDEKTGDREIGIYAENKAHCPITVLIDFPQMKNVTISEKVPFTYVVPANTEKQLIMTVTTKKDAKSSFQYGYTFFLGDTHKAAHNDDYVYMLPFDKGTEILLGQGYRGRFSHKDIMALDFNLDKGSNVYAARGGVVAFVKSNSDKGCKSTSCRDNANYIIIQHDDGSFGQYVHLQLNGSIVKPGQSVKTGDLIGYSGNTGWSSGPHLHFEVFVPQNNFYMTVPTKFQTGKEKVEYLEEGKSYTAFR